jgi:uncharacterized protein
MNVEKPVPAQTHDSRKFWFSCSRNKLILQRCAECATTQYYPRSICMNCGSGNIEWVDSPGKGTVYSYTVIHRAPSAAFGKDTPYVLAIIQLVEGPRMMSNIVDCDPADVRIGSEVEAGFEKRAEDIGVPVFRLAKRS